MAQDRFMALDALALMRHSNASWKLLASDDAAFCCAFFLSGISGGQCEKSAGISSFDGHASISERKACPREGAAAGGGSARGGSEAVSAPMVG